MSTGPANFAVLLVLLAVCISSPFRTTSICISLALVDKKVYSFFLQIGTSSLKDHLSVAFAYF
jgi:uncharacterized membrane protein